jgi:hypothetical protein
MPSIRKVKIKKKFQIIIFLGLTFMIIWMIAYTTTPVFMRIAGKTASHYMQEEYPSCVYSEQLRTVEYLDVPYITRFSTIFPNKYVFIYQNVENPDLCYLVEVYPGLLPFWVSNESTEVDMTKR